MVAPFSQWPEFIDSNYHCRSTACSCTTVNSDWLSVASKTVFPAEWPRRMATSFNALLYNLPTTGKNKEWVFARIAERS